MVLPELTQITIIALRPHPELIGQLGGHIQPEIRESNAAIVVRRHGQPVVSIGVDVCLGSKPVDLDAAVEQA